MFYCDNIPVLWLSYINDVLGKSKFKQYYTANSFK